MILSIPITKTPDKGSCRCQGCGRGCWCLHRPGGIEIVALVLEDGSLAQYGKASWNEELTMVILREFYSHMLAIGRQTFTDVNCYIEDGSLDASNQFALGEGRCLEMEASHHAIARHAFVVLHEIDFSHFLFKLSLREAFEKVASGIFEDFGLDDDNAFYFCFNYFHSWCYRDPSLRSGWHKGNEGRHM